VHNVEHNETELFKVPPHRVNSVHLVKQHYRRRVMLSAHVEQKYNKWSLNTVYFISAPHVRTALMKLLRDVVHTACRDRESVMRLPTLELIIYGFSTGWVPYLPVHERPAYRFARCL